MNYPYLKQCPICEKYFIVEGFEQASRKYCYECSPEERKGDYTPLYHAMKKKLIELKGGKCQKCGYDKCEDALQFHHRNPSQKSFALSEKSSHLRWEDFLKESEKCDLLCANCHAEEHSVKNFESYKNDKVFEQPPEKIPLYKDLNINNKTYCIDCGQEISSGSIRCIKCYAKIQRVVERPSREELKKLIREEPFTHISSKYGVSDKAIVKWCIAEHLPHRKKDINNFSDEEWETI